MKQSKLGSLIEALVNVAVGFIVSVLSTLLILPLFGFDVTIGESIIISIFFTFISIARSYFIRRFFEYFRPYYSKGD